MPQWSNLNDSLTWHGNERESQWWISDCIDKMYKTCTPPLATFPLFLLITPRNCNPLIVSCQQTTSHSRCKVPFHICSVESAERQDLLANGVELHRFPHWLLVGSNAITPLAVWKVSWSASCNQWLFCHGLQQGQNLRWTTNTDAATCQIFALLTREWRTFCTL